MSDVIKCKIAEEMPAGLSVSKGGASYALPAGETVELPAAVAAGLVDHPFVKAPAAFAKKVRAASSADESADEEPDGSTMADDDQAAQEG